MGASQDKHLDEYFNLWTTGQIASPERLITQSDQSRWVDARVLIFMEHWSLSGESPIGLNDILCSIDGPDNFLISSAMFTSCDVSLSGADLQALIHWCDPTRLGAQILIQKKP